MSSVGSLNLPPRGACESCHRYKEKCIFNHGNAACTRCTSLGRSCLTRKKKRMGRRPEAGQFPHGNCSIIEFNPESHQRQHQQTESTSAIQQSESTNSAALTPRLKPSSYQATLRLAKFNPYPPSPPKTYSNFDHMLSTKEGFYAAHRKFMLGQGFIDAYQTAVRVVFARDAPVMMSAYSATLTLLSHRKLQPAGVEGLNLVVGSHCLEWLGHQYSCIKDVLHAAVVLAVGQLLLVYNILLPCPSSRAITRGVLLSVTDWYPALLQQPELDPITLAPVLLDTVDSLIRREAPIVRLPDATRPIVDRFLGLCTPLQPLLFDLAERSYRAKMHAPAMPPGDSHNGDHYSETERQIASWTPELPPDFFTTYDSLEVAAMLGQAASYRIAALLVIHRLRYPLGFQDRLAHGYAESIFEELSFMKQWPVDGATGLGLDFPLVVALLELPSLGEELFINLNLLRFQPQLGEKVVQLVRWIRRAYDAGYDGLWFDLVQDRLDILIP
ncbi:hypothetical protein V1525DRAFT_28845 [Lipomyces kononenkoae]|uniref:Uncharacterized protein n=1 Tax=Lipomyces kononenkoae TaxID=34357 RepID=A0ACC3T841_LIPKO